MTADPFSKLRFAKTVPTRVQKAGYAGIGVLSSFGSLTFGTDQLRDVGSNFGDGQVKGESLEEGDGISRARSSARGSHAVSSSFYCTLSGSFESVAKINYKSVFDGRSGNPGACCIKHFESFLSAYLIQKGKPSTRVFVSSHTLSTCSIS